MKTKRNITLAVITLSLLSGVALATTVTQPAQTTAPTGYMQGCAMGVNGMNMAQMSRGGMHHNGERMQSGRNAHHNGEGMQSGQNVHHGGEVLTSPEQVEKRDLFLNSTVKLRKQLQETQFSFMEASREPTTTLGELQQQRNEILAMRQQLLSKHQEIFPVL